MAKTVTNITSREEVTESLLRAARFAAEVLEQHGRSTVGLSGNDCLVLAGSLRNAIAHTQERL